MSFNQWKKCKVSDILNFRRGHDLPKSKMTIGEYPVVGSNGVIAYHNEYTTKAPCLTIGRSGNVGKPHFLKEDCWAHNTTLYVDDFKGNDPEFIYYFLKTLNLGHYAGGSAVPTLNRNHIHPIEIVFPENIEEQKGIANILLFLDEKIETNNQINIKLEEMAQVIFKQWFVDFEFQNEEGKPYKSSGGEMVESEFGMIPKGWKIGTLNELIKISSGKRPSKRANSLSKETSIPLIGASSIMGYTNDFNYNEPVLVIGRVGTHGVVQRFKTKIWTSDNTLVIKSQNYEFVNQILNIIDYKGLNRGSTQPLITQGDIKNYKIIIPSEHLLIKFESLISRLYLKHGKNVLENEKLNLLRDTLLPKLMSGEICVPVE